MGGIKKERDVFREDNYPTRIVSVVAFGPPEDRLRLSERSASEKRSPTAPKRKLRKRFRLTDGPRGYGSISFTALMAAYLPKLK